MLLMQSLSIIKLL